MAEEKANDLITEQELEENKKKSENVDKLLTPPEGKVLDGLRAFCPIHGEITYANRTLEYTLFRKNEQGTVFPVTYRDVICEACLSDMWKKYCAENMPKDENGETQSITVSPVFITEIEAKEKQVKMAEEFVENIKQRGGSEEKLQKAVALLEKLKKELADLEAKEAAAPKEEKKEIGE